MGMMYERQLAIPAELKEMYPLTAKMNETIQQRRAQDGQDDIEWLDDFEYEDEEP